MTNHAFAIFSLTLLALGGCFSGSPGAPTAGNAILLSLPDGLLAAYSFGPDYPTIRQTNFTIASKVTDEGAALTYGYDYLDDCTDCDSAIEFRLAEDGSWAHAEFPCLPPVPDSRSEGCIEVLGG